MGEVTDPEHGQPNVQDLDPEAALVPGRFDVREAPPSPIDDPGHPDFVAPAADAVPVPEVDLP